MGFLSRLRGVRRSAPAARGSAHAPARRGIEHLPNTPLAELSAPAERFAEIYGSSKVQAQRWFVVAMLALTLAVVAVASVATVFPLKEVRPWIVEVDSRSGVINRPVEVVRIDPGQAVIKAELARWAEAVYTIDPLRSRELLRWANARTADLALAQFTEYRVRERIAERIHNDQDRIREAKVTAVDASRNGTAFIFVTTQERVGSAANAAPERIRRFRVTVNYRLTAATQEADLLANPLGLYITYFADAEERAP